MTNHNGPESGPRTVVLAGREVTIEPPSGRKASRAFALMRAIGQDAPDLVKAWGEYETEYQASHFIELDRAQALFRYGPEPLVVEGEVVRHPAGHPRAGELVMVPSPLESMTDAAWQAADNKLRLPRSPSTEERLAAMLHREELEAAEQNVYRLVALFAMSNADVKAYRRDGSLPEKLDALVDELLDDAGFDELVELAVIVGEVIEARFRAKAEELGGRMGNALRALGVDPRALRPQTTAEEAQTAPTEELDQPAPDEEGPTDGTATSTTTPPSSRPTSSGDGVTASDGNPTPSSTNPGTSSRALASASSESG